MNNDRICTYCGAHMSASHQFCPSCGNRVNHNYPKQHPNRSSTPKRENDTLLFTITAILIVLLVIICLLTYLLNNVNKKTFKPGTEPLPIVSSSSKSWYKPDPFFSEDMFNNIERSNKSIIAEYEKSRGWR